jgi:hypothetical protein
MRLMSDERARWVEFALVAIVDYSSWFSISMLRSIGRVEVRGGSPWPELRQFLLILHTSCAVYASRWCVI